MGPVSVTDLPSLYSRANAVIFPSLLECFSVTPLEGMRSALPVFASDRDFVRTVCGGAATYFEPTDVKDAIGAISAALREPLVIRARVEQGMLTAQNWASSRSRTLRYLQLMDAEYKRAVSGD